MVAQNLIVNAKIFRSWIESYCIYEHSPICLHIEFEVEQGNYPFKFNHSWIRESNFDEFVHKTWKHIYLSSKSSPMIYLMNTLRTLKLEVCKWEKKKKQLMQNELQDIEKDIGSLFKNRMLEILSKEELSLFKTLEDRKRKILLKEEELWRLKSRSLSLQ